MPGMTTNMLNLNTSTVAVQTESQAMSPSALSKGSYTNDIQQTSPGREGQESLLQERQYSVMNTDIEGLKLDLLILQKKVEENANLLSANIRKQEEHMVSAEGIDYKTRHDYLLSSLRKKEKDIEELEEKCLSFENRVLSLEQENDSLRLALQIIVQEKNVCDSRPQKADDSWSLVENTHPAKSMKNKRSQQTITSHNIGTRNRFEPLGNEVQDSFINVNPTPNNEASEDKRNKVPSTRHSQTSNFRNRTHRATRISDSERNDQANQSAKRKEVFIVGDSILKNLQGRKISRSAKVKVSSFPGCTAIDMRDHIKPTLRKNPDAIVIHVGTNSLRSSTSVRDCAEEIANLATMIGNESSADLAISGIIPRSDDESVAVKVPGVNKLLKTFCNQNGWGFVDHSNISPEHDLNRSGLHLNTKGTARLATNFINYLRDD
ncbi:uncharacterized protein [Acropora muricata]|uniref:uncharacterized protein n=1 Tax=Acropora muricata TaxID=159855 RepID=UPI0034E42E72